MFCFFFTDPERQFLPQQSDAVLITIFDNLPFVLPCRVTNPDLKVVLDMQNGVENTIVEPNERTIKYNPKWGFRISGDHHLFRGVVDCSASAGNLKQQQSYYISNEGKIDINHENNLQLFSI